MTLVVDTAHCPATCEEEGETARCESEVTTAWVLDRELHDLAGVVDQTRGSASVEGSILVIGPRPSNSSGWQARPAP